MTEKDNNTITFSPLSDKGTIVRNTMITVKSSLEEKGYNPVNQIVGYIMSGDPTYITSYNEARSLITKIDRDELLEEIIRSYFADRQ